MYLHKQQWVVQWHISYKKYIICVIIVVCEDTNNGKRFYPLPNLLKINKLSTFIPAFLSEKSIYAGLSTAILFPAELFLTNTNTLIKSLEIDFGDKIKRNFVFGEMHKTAPTHSKLNINNSSFA